MKDAVDLLNGKITELKEEIAGLKRNLVSAQNAIRVIAVSESDCQEENTRLREALEKFANVDNWDSCSEHPLSDSKDYFVGLGPQEGWEIAQEALQTPEKNSDET